jgi:Tol biopolymer transport system component
VVSSFVADSREVGPASSRRTVRSVIGASACLVVALIGSGSATATFPGRNGLIAFVSDRHPLLENSQFFAVGVDGGLPRMLTGVAQEAARGVPSPEGGLVAYTRADGHEHPSEIWLMKADGSAQRLLVSGGSDPVWSPDGRTIAYYAVGTESLRTIRIDGSKSRLLAEAARNPSWSPNGHRLVFEADIDNYHDAHEVRIANADGTNIRVLAREARRPAWSPTGSLIAYNSFRGPRHARRYGIYVVRPDGSGRRRLGPGGAGWYLPIWSSGGVRLAYLCDQRPRALCTADAQGRHRHVIALGVRNDSNDFGKWGTVVAAWSPRGLRLAYARKDGIFVVSADGHGRRRVMRNSNGALLGRLRWSRDGRQLLFTQMLASNDIEIYTVRADGTRLRPLTNNDVADLAPSWAPDGSRLAFLRQRGRQSKNDIWVMNASGRRQRLVARNGSVLTVPSWTPDGRRIRFNRGRWTYSISAAGGDERRLMPARYMSSWSPDGTKLAYLRDRPSGGQYVFIARPDGTHARPVATVDHADRLSWSPDGTTLALGSDAHGEERGIYTIRVDGSQETRVVTTPYAGSSASFSPDGTALAFNAGTGYPTSRIEVIGVDGSGRRLVTAARGANADPDWQPLAKGA